MKTYTATITGVALLVAGQTDWLVNEVRPATFAAADTALAFASLGRTSAWELDTNGGVEATVAPVDNRFNGTVAARLDQAVGTTHGGIEAVLATSVQDGDLITDSDQSALYVVAGSRLEDGGMKIHMVGEGQVWDQRHTTVFHGLVWVARKR
jgi:hypothetical protein